MPSENVFTFFCSFLNDLGAIFSLYLGSAHLLTNTGAEGSFALLSFVVFSILALLYSILFHPKFSEAKATSRRNTNVRLPESFLKSKHPVKTLIS